MRMEDGGEQRSLPDMQGGVDAGRLLRIQRDLALDLNHSRDFHAVLERVLQAASQVFGIDCGGTYLVRQPGGDLDLVAHHNLSDGFVSLVRHLASTTPQAMVVRRGQPTYATTEHFDPYIVEHLRLEGIRLLAVIPVHYEGRIVAVMNLASRQVASLSEEARQVLETMVAQIGPVVVRVQAEEDLKRERQSLWHMLEASDHERQIISYEIHDGLAQYLAAANMQFQLASHLWASDPEEAKKAYDTAAQLVAQSHFEARRLISEVRPPVIDEVGIETAIAHLVHEQRRRGGPKIQYRSCVRFDRLPAILENSLYRIAQEALTNACRHSRSERVKVSLAQKDHNIQLAVRDWGAGFDPESVAAGHFGLEGIRQRVRLLGGRLKIKSSPDAGTLIQVVVSILEKHAER